MQRQQHVNLLVDWAALNSTAGSTPSMLKEWFARSAHPKQEVGPSTVVSVNVMQHHSAAAN